LRELETSIISCTISQPASFPSIKKGKKASAAALTDQPALEVILHDTVIFPEGGGQPSDTGIIKTADGRTWTVTQAKRHGGHAVHYVLADKAEDGLASLTPGTNVTIALGELGFDRRYDHVRPRLLYPNEVIKLEPNRCPCTHRNISFLQYSKIVSIFIPFPGR